ncbi:MAG: TolC family protein [Gemmatimonadaceae bacterium]|nr:TolC family protein [Gemmatimonadaceae bacterium]
MKVGSNGWPLLGVGLALIAGCTANIVDKGWQPMRPLGSDLETFRPPIDPGSAAQRAPLVEPIGPLNLRQALALAMMYSPQLQSTAWDVRVAEARALQAGVPPNPRLGFDLETLGALSAAETVLQLGQAVFLTDKLYAQRRVAELERDVAGWDYEATRLNVLTGATKSFAAVVAAQEKVALARELAAISDKVLKTVEDRVASGKSPPLDQMKARIEQATVAVALEQTRQELSVARARLAASWSSVAPAFTMAEGRMEPMRAIPSDLRLHELVAQNPSIARWATEMQRRQAVVKLEQRRAIPDVTLAAGWKHDASVNEDGWAASASLEVPIFDRNQGGIKAARYSLAKADAESRAALAAAHLELAEHYAALATAHARISILRGRVLPEAARAFEASTAGFAEGKFTFLEMLDAQRTLFESQNQHVEALADFYAAATNVEGLVGQALSDVELRPEPAIRAPTQTSEK